VYTVLFIYGHLIFFILNGVGVIKAALSLGLGCLSAILLPLRKDLFELAPPFVQKKIGSVPVISVIGAFAFLGIVGLLLFGQIIPAFESGLNAAKVAATFILFFAGLPFYYFVKRHRRKTEGIDLGLVYARIPPE
jgi:hypothetical protein